MKKFLALLLVFLMLVTTFTGCSEESVSSQDDVSSDVSSEDVSSDDVVSEEESSEPEDTVEEPEYTEPEYIEPEEEEEPVESDKPLTPEYQRLENMLAGEDEELNKDAIYSEGNLTRLAAAIKKSKSGKKVTIVCYGNGANTGILLDVVRAENTYNELLSDWWNNNIGPCQVIRAGTDNITSITACYRVEHDVLRYNPDLVLLDFAVQDNIGGAATTNAVGYDNLIRSILEHKSKPAIISLMLTGAEQQTFTMNPNNAEVFATASKIQKTVAQYHNIPVIDFENAFWDNSVEVVEVTTKKEIPLINWRTIALDNIIMSDEGHSVLMGTIRYFLESVMNKLNKISTKDFAYPKEGYFGRDDYMNYSYVSIGDIIEGKAKGYSADLDTLGLAKYNYGYSEEKFASPLTPNIRTSKHYDYIEGEHAEEWKDFEVAPHYLTITLPEAIETNTYFTLCVNNPTSKSVSSNSPYKDFGVSLECYDENDALIGSPIRSPRGHYKETISLGMTPAVKLAAGTKKVTFKIYLAQGTVLLFGFSSLKK